MFDPSVWDRLAQLVESLRVKRSFRASRNALLVAILEAELPDEPRSALDLVGRHDLEPADRGGQPHREQHSMRLPQSLLGRLDDLGRLHVLPAFRVGDRPL